MLDKYFYFLMSFPIAAVVAFGFSHTIGQNLIHPVIPRPSILYIHAAVFTAWLGFFPLQSLLVRTRSVTWHRRIGRFGAGMAATMLILGVTTAITMARFNAMQLHQSDTDFGLMIPLFDMLCFGSTLALAIYWRKKPEYHRRLMFVATFALTAAGFGRFPEWRLFPSDYFYAGVDILILFGVARDLVVDRRIHRVYLVALPLFIAGQTIVTYTYIHHLSYWQKISHAVLG
ncbi:MAG TPA: hypothetical protein VGL28_01640 [Steroidobacteraceae bacterium]